MFFLLFNYTIGRGSQWFPYTDFVSKKNLFGPTNTNYDNTPESHTHNLNHLHRHCARYFVSDQFNGRGMIRMHPMT